MTRAVIVSPDPGNTSGGVERMCTLLAGVFEDFGWEVQIVGAKREPSRWLYRVGAGHLARAWLAAAPARALRPDLVITNGFLGLHSPRGVPRVHVYHGTLVGDSRAEGPALGTRERLRRLLGGGAAEALAGRGATVVCVSESAAEEVERFYHVSSDAVIANGVDTAVFRPSPRSQARQAMGLAENGRYCLFVGRMQYRKGADLLVASAQEAGFELMIAGAGGDQRARNLGVLAPAELAVAYAAADCVLFPSRYEACSYVVLEALACGAPLITTRVGWMPTLLDAVPEYAALCVAPERDDIVAHLRGLADLDLEDLTGKARAWVLEHNSVEAYAASWQTLLGSLGFAPTR